MAMDPNAVQTVPDLADDESGVWISFEEQIKDPKANPNAGGTGMKTLYLWKIDPLAINLIPEAQSSRRYCIFYHDLEYAGGKPDEEKITFVKWDDMSAYRCLTFPYVLRPFDNLMGYTYGEEMMLTKIFRKKRSREIKFDWQSMEPKPENGNTRRTDYFDRAFAIGQKVAKIWKPAGGLNDKGWSKLPNQPWQKTNKNSPLFDEDNLDVPGGKENRKFDHESDGIAFLMGLSSLPAPDVKDPYIKISNIPIAKTVESVRTSHLSCAGQLMDGDPLAAHFGNSATGIYIAKSTMDALRTSNSYDWDAAAGRVYCRRFDGRLGSIRIRPKGYAGGVQTRSTDWWSDCFNRSITQEMYVVRSRNPNPLELLLVIPRLSRVTVNELTDIVQNIMAKKKSARCYQTAQVVHAKAAQDLKKIFNFKLSVSPFGDYETWIKEQDYLSFLHAYPRRPFPKDQNTITKIITTEINPSEKAAARNKEFETKLAAQIQEARSRYPEEVGAMITNVSLVTVKNAHEPGARRKADDQGRQVGGHAVDLAKAFGWQDPGTTVPSKTVDGITWNQTGNYPSEWLHRSAFAWGNKEGNRVSQVNTNIIFGSSEANSQMMRYEKAWQSLFRREQEIRDIMFEQKLIPPSEGFAATLLTVNTSKSFPIRALDRSIDGKKIILTEYVRGLTSKPTDAPLIKVKKTNPIYPTATELESVSLAPGKTPYTDYWNWSDEAPVISFSLYYSLMFRDPSALIDMGVLATDFYPFERSFFTSLESEIDQSILRLWSDKAKAKLVHKHATGKTNPVAIGTLALGTYGRSRHNVTSRLSHAEVWKKVLNKESIQAGQAELQNASVAVLADSAEFLGRPRIPLISSYSLAARSAHSPSVLIDGAPLPPGEQPMSPSVTLQLPVPTIACAMVPGNLITALNVVETAPDPLMDVEVPTGFTIKSSISLFGLFNATRYSFYGENDEGIREIVPLSSDDLSLGEILPCFHDTILDGLVLRNTRFMYNEFSGPVDLAGTWIETDLVFKDDLTIISDVLKNYFHQEDPGVRFQALLSTEHNWSKPIDTPNLCIRGSLRKCAISLGDMVTLTDFRIGITAGYTIQATSENPLGEEILKWGFNFGGSARMNFHKSLPVLVEYSISYFFGFMHLELRSGPSSVLKDFMGVQDLTLSSFSFSTSLSNTGPPSLLQFTATASIELRHTTLLLSGYYSPNEWALACDLQDLDLQSLRSLYEDLFGAKLHIPDLNIHISDIGFIVSSNGITLNANIQIGEHSSAAGTLRLDRLGVIITGSVGDININDDIQLEAAEFDAFIGRANDTDATGAGRSWYFALSGVISITTEELSGVSALKGIKAALYLGKDAAGALQWTIFGEVKTDFRLSDIAPALKGDEMLDLALEDVAIIASSAPGLNLAGPQIPVAYPIIQGVQIAARLDKLEKFDQTMGNEDSTSMVVSAAYDTATSAFSIGFLFAPQKLRAKNDTITSGPVALYIDLSGTPALRLSLELFIKVQNQPDLPFIGGFTIGPRDATLYAGLKPGYLWQNPFGLSKRLTLGPKVLLDIGVDWDAPVWPSRSSIAAGISVGKTHGDADIGIREVPDEELLHLHVANLKIIDLIKFAGTLFDTNVPVTDDFLEFNDFEFYLSGGTTIGPIRYPPGAKFSCEATMFGKAAMIDCEVDKTQKAIMIQGWIDPFEVGPLSVSGVAPGARTGLYIALGPFEQQINVSGAVTILDLSAKLDFRAKLLGKGYIPAPTFYLDAKMAFVDHLDFVLNASSGEMALTSLSALQDVQFNIDFYFAQDILDYITEHVHQQIKAAKQKAQQGIDDAVKTLDEEKVKYNARLNAALADLDKKKADFEADEAKAIDKIRIKKEELDGVEQTLLDTFNKANQIFQDLCDSLSNKLTEAQQAEHVQVEHARQAVADKEREMTGVINHHLDEVLDAEQKMKRDFGDALAKLERARVDAREADRVASRAKGELDDAERELHDCHWWESPYYAAKVAGLSIAYASEKGAYEVADEFLWLCEAVVEDSKYLADAALIKVYSKAVETARDVARTAMQEVNDDLKRVEKESKALVEAADRALKDARNGSQELVNSGMAKKALDDFKDSVGPTLAEFRKVLYDVIKAGTEAAMELAKLGVQAARAGNLGIEAAKASLHAFEFLSDEVLDFGDWLVNRSRNVLNIHSIHLTGNLHGLCNGTSKLAAAFDATVIETRVSFTLDYTPGHAEDLITECFKKVFQLSNSPSILVPKRPGFLTPLPPLPPNLDPYIVSPYSDVPENAEQRTRDLLEVFYQDISNVRVTLSEYLERPENEDDKQARDMWTKLELALSKLVIAMQQRLVWDDRKIQDCKASRFRQPWLGDQKWSSFYVDKILRVL